MISVTAGITGIQAVQQDILKAAAMVEPGESGAAGHIVKYVTLGLHRHAVAYTHVDTGTLRASQFVEIQGLTGSVYVGGGRNPKSGKPASEYAVYEHDRGGEHAFYDLAVRHVDELIDRAVGLYLA